MAKKKEVKKLVLPEEGYTGTTVQHILTADDLKNNPELVEIGKAEGEEITIITTEVDEPTTESDVFTGNPKEAKKIADAHGLTEVYENKGGEFFTSENLALLSVKGDRKKIKLHIF